MKLECTVTAVSGSGETVAIRLEGRQANDAEWRRDGTQELQVTGSEKVKRAFYLGRKVIVTVEPR
jgi:hypothetical protein